MSRFDFGGYRGPEGELPTEALPDAHAEFTPTLILELENGVDFIPEVYLSFGYTHYEVWCFGAAGGRGGDASGQGGFIRTQGKVKLSSSDWNLYKEWTRIESRMDSDSGTWDDTRYYDRWDLDNNGLSNVPEGLYTDVQMLELRNPQHEVYQIIYASTGLLLPYTTNGGWGGGGGGGGGLQITRGLLEDLPETVPVVVGQPGTNGALGQFIKSGSWTPKPELFDVIWDIDNDPQFENVPNPGFYRRYLELWNHFNPIQYTYPGVHAQFPNPTDGTDGGASSFGSDICRASGGKAGQKSVIPVLNQPPIRGGRGGDGGVGGQTIVGGGAPGGTHSDTHTISWNSGGSYYSYPSTPPGDGTWDGEIGQGGGGGQTGIAPIYNGNMGRQSEVVNTPMSTHSGGKGSLDNDDPTVYGPGELASVSGSFRGGGGGGAHRSGKKFGSFAPDYLPRGGVLIRLYQQT